MHKNFLALHEFDILTRNGELNIIVVWYSLQQCNWKHNQRDFPNGQVDYNDRWAVPDFTLSWQI